MTLWVTGTTSAEVIALSRAAAMGDYGVGCAENVFNMQNMGKSFCVHRIFHVDRVVTLVQPFPYKMCGSAGNMQGYIFFYLWTESGRASYMQVIRAKIWYMRTGIIR